MQSSDQVLKCSTAACQNSHRSGAHSSPAVQLGCLPYRTVDVLHLATNIRYVFDCYEWVNKKCKNERIMLKPWVQHPPVQHQDWRVTEVFPAQVLDSTVADHAAAV